MKRLIKKLFNVLVVTIGALLALVVSTSLLSPSVINLIHLLEMTQPHMLSAFGQRIDGNYVLINQGVVTDLVERPDGSICYIDYQTQLRRCAKVPVYILTPFQIQ